MRFALVPLAALASLTGAMPPALAATPAPTPTACQSPSGFGISASASKVQSGDSVTLTVSYFQCGGGPEHHFTVSARPLGQFAPITSVGQLTTPAQQTGTASLTVQPNGSTTYLVTGDGQAYSQAPSLDVTVDRTGGVCTGALTLSAPTQAPITSPVTVTGTSSDTSTVRISFRKRGQAAFTVRRTLTPSGTNHGFGFTFSADEDYRLLASNDRCDSPAVLVTAAPVLTGPSTARKGSTVTLIVRAAPGTPLAVAFRRAGQATFTIRRTGTADSRGFYTTSYVADADYRYYAAERPGQTSNQALTQVR